METIETTVKNNLCISCGICSGNCPSNCIKMQLYNYQYIPIIDNNECILCGQCLNVCPVNQIADYDEAVTIPEYLLGEYKEILYVQAKDQFILEDSTSGGFITQTVQSLLSKGIYQSAFLVEGYHYDHQLCTKRFSIDDNLDQTSKSRYLMVSHENTVQYIIDHPEEKVIIVATPCATQGLVNVIHMHKLHRENYLLIGLFCDKTMTQGVVEYFAQHPCGEGRKLNNLYFRTKEAGGWPGNVRLEYEDGSIEDLPNTERMKVKDYFMPFRCSVCLDKLNRLSDISVGDNYIPKNEDKNGANSIIIRTKLGEEAWRDISSEFLFHEDDINEFVTSQKLETKERNYVNGRIKGLYPGRELQEDKTYRSMKERIRIGHGKDVYLSVNNHIKKNQGNVLKKIYRKFSSMFKQG